MASRFAFPSFGAVALDSEAAVIRQALLIPTLLAAAMLAVGFTLANVAGVDGTGLFAPYLATGFAFALLSTLAYLFILFARLARQGAKGPIGHARSDLAPKLPLLILPVLVFPLFLVGFTTAKTAIPFLVGYSWDAFWADADKLIFGDDVWRLTHGWFGTRYMPVWEGLYSASWGGMLMLYMANIALYAKARTVGVVYVAMLATWLVGGWFMAYVTSAAGPVFAHLVDPSLSERFAALRVALDASLDPEGSTRLTQAYLAQALDHPVAVKGGGVSAMPSMHLAAVSIYVLSARGTRWLFPAIAFWLIIFLGSGYLGYHYWIDGIVAAAIAWLCWRLAEACFRERSDQRRQSAGGWKS